MRVLALLFLISIVGIVSAKRTDKLRTTSRSSDEIREMLAAVGGCNANICFALDGSGSITEEEYDMQKNFVLDVVNALTGNPLEVSAVQYGKLATPIISRTADLDAFTIAVADSEQVRSSSTNIASGVFFCSRQLVETIDAFKMVILGDGRNNITGRAVKRARRFRRRTGGKVCAVGVGFTNDRKLLRLVGRDPSLLLTVDEYLELTDIVEELVEMVCDVTLL